MSAIVPFWRRSRARDDGGCDDRQAGSPGLWDVGPPGDAGHTRRARRRGSACSIGAPRRLPLLLQSGLLGRLLRRWRPMNRDRCGACEDRRQAHEGSAAALLLLRSLDWRDRGGCHRNGRSVIAEDITDRCRRGLDRCEVENPRGACCLGDVRQAAKLALAATPEPSEPANDQKEGTAR